VERDWELTMSERLALMQQLCEQATRIAQAARTP
jgi:hypothetical protein